MKITKRLLNSILCLVLSLALFAGVCYAWFVASSDANIEGIFSGVSDPDIQEFSVNAYYLDYVNASDKTQGYKKRSTTPLSQNSSLDEYSFSGKCTALLVELTLTVKEVAEAYTYAVGVESKTSTDLQVVKDTNGNLDYFTWFLSNAIYLQNAAYQKASNTYLASGSKTYSFVEDVSLEKTSVIVLQGDAFAGQTNGYSVTLYYLLDYKSDNIDTVLSALAVEHGGGLHTPTKLITDPTDLIFTVYQNK
jgi:hypothetical protein